MFQQNNVVLIGNSVAEQSKSIAHLNKRIINIDSYNDRDLIGESYKNSDPCGLVNNEVITILENLKLFKEDTLIVVSSDYDKDNNYYELLKKYGYIVGNNYKNILKLKNIDELFYKLELNNIKYPEKINNIKNNHESLVLKNPYTSGGLGVRKIEKEDIKIPEKNEYYQKYIKGQTYSVLFMANSDKKFSIIGINQIFNKRTSFSDFCFSGATSNIKFNKSVTKRLKYIINFFVEEYNLIGLNGIDFILSDNIYFLELNPRITQTCFMYDKNFKEGYVHAHIESDLNNDLTFNDNINDHFSSFETLFSNSSFIFNYEIENYDFVSNIPQINTHIEVGQPICTISVTSEYEKKTKKILLDNISLIKSKLKNIEII